MSYTPPPPPQGSLPSVPSGPHRPAEPGVLDPLVRAWEAMIDLLFHAGTFTRWLTMALAVFLLNCGRGGSGGAGSMNCGSNFPGAGGGGGGGGGPAAPDVEQVIEETLMPIASFLITYWGMILLLMLAGFLVVLGIRALTLWIGSRGEFIFLDQAAWNHEQLQNPWNHYAENGNSLFLLRFIIDGLLYAYFWGATALVLSAYGLPLIEPFAEPGGLDRVQVDASILWPIVGIYLPGILVGIPVFLFKVYLNNFVVPVMYARRLRVLAGLQETWGLTRQYPLAFVLYLLLRLLVYSLAAIVISLISCAAICTPLCFLSCIPCLGQLMLGYLLTLVTLPAWVLLLIWPATFMQQFGPQYTVLQYTLEPPADQGLPATGSWLDKPPSSGPGGPTPS